MIVYLKQDAHGLGRFVKPQSGSPGPNRHNSVRERRPGETHNAHPRVTTREANGAQR